MSATTGMRRNRKIFTSKWKKKTNIIHEYLGVKEVYRQGKLNFFPIVKIHSDEHILQRVKQA